MLEVFVYFEIIAEAITLIEFDNTISEKVKDLRKESTLKLLPIILEFHRQQFKVETIKTILEKKINFILNATTKAEMQEILSLSVPYYNYAEIVPKGRFHVEEEELLLWFGCLSQCALNEEATKRIWYLCEKLYPKEVENVFK